MCHYCGVFTLLCASRFVILGHHGRGEASSHVPALIGSYMMLIFYLYIFLTMTSLDIFNCNSTTPPDGHTYVDRVWGTTWVSVCCHAQAAVALVPFTLCAGMRLLWHVDLPLLSSKEARACWLAAP